MHIHEKLAAVKSFTVTNVLFMMLNLSCPNPLGSFELHKSLQSLAHMKSPSMQQFCSLDP